MARRTLVVRSNILGVALTTGRTPLDPIRQNLKRGMTEATNKFGGGSRPKAAKRQSPSMPRLKCLEKEALTPE